MSQMLRSLLDFFRHSQNQSPALLIFFLLLSECLRNSGGKSIAVAVAEPLYIVAVIAGILFLDVLNLREGAIDGVFENCDAYLYVVLKADKPDTVRLFSVPAVSVPFAAIVLSDNRREAYYPRVSPLAAGDVGSHVLYLLLLNIFQLRLRELMLRHELAGFQKCRPCLMLIWAFCQRQQLSNLLFVVLIHLSLPP